jgi:hypothetical protein
MNDSLNGVALVALLASALLTPTSAQALLGGDGKGKVEADCFIGLEASTETLEPFGKKGKKQAITCEDGSPCDLDGTVNGSCQLQMRACVNQPGDPSCTPGPLKKIVAFVKPKGAPKVNLNATDTGGELPTDGSSACGAFQTVDVPVKGKAGNKPGAKVKLLAKAKPKDKDKFFVLCKAAPVTPPATKCDPNPATNAEAPDELRMTISQSGSDLDNGWTGVSHSFAVTPNGTISGCLTNCDGTTDVVCDVNGSVGEGSLNGPVFGAPLPLLAAGVPVCVVNRFNPQRPVTGTANVATGATDIEVSLLSDVFFTTVTEVCPRCNAQGKCTSGTRQGAACTVDATLVVAEAAGNKTYDLSRDCPPAGNSSTLDIVLPLTSGTTDPLTLADCSNLPGTTPQPNNCGAAGCGGPCTGARCVQMIDDPANPGTMVCQDSKGGISQVCCNNDSTVSCFPLENAGSITRTGRVDAPSPALPDATYPKTGTGVLGAVFCEGRTQNFNVDNITGLPGPAALLLNGTFEWMKVPAAP